jgi:hypothetical protein
MSEQQPKNTGKSEVEAPPGPPLDKQITDAITKACDAVRSLSPDGQRRVLTSVAAIFGLNTQQRPAAQQQRAPQQNSGNRNNNGGR